MMSVPFITNMNGQNLFPTWIYIAPFSGHSIEQSFPFGTRRDLIRIFTSRLLSLGYEGMSESFDFRFTTDLPLAEVAQRLNATMPEGITIQTVRPPVRKAGDIDRAEYTLKLSCKDLSPNELSEKLTVFLQQEKIETQKHSKKGMRTIDLKPLILAQKIETADVVNLSLTLPAGTQSNINPTLLTDAFATFEGLDLDYQNICRDRVLCADGTAFI
ncbi:MAG: TIGR03936 family radical SAM-associated protein [Oscillospiraceae bacterium]